AIVMKWTRSLNSWPGGAWFANRPTPQVAFYRETHLLVEMIPTPQKNVCARCEALGARASRALALESSPSRAPLSGLQSQSRRVRKFVSARRRNQVAAATAIQSFAC